jgi:4-amino-4-deoxy-L-arabinose transferase-like glycosyltransferase
MAEKSINGASLVGWLIKAITPNQLSRPFVAEQLQRLWTSGRIAFLFLVVTYLLPGLIGHDPWKQDETYIFGIIQHLLESGDWVVPTVAGEPFMEKPPLYYWVAAAFSTLFSPWLPLHDGARLASGFFMALTCCAIGWSARQWWGYGRGRYAVLALLSCFGIVLYGHLMLTDLPILTGFAIALCGFVLARTRALPAGLLIGTGIGIGFLGKGVLAIGVIGMTAVLLPAFFRDWRHRTYLNTLAFATLVSLPWLVIWPTALYLRSPILFRDWFWLNNVGRFVGFSVAKLGAPHKSGYWVQTLPWFTFPALPLALATLWRMRIDALKQTSVQCCVVMCSVMLAVLGISASARPNYALPLLAPLALLAAPTAIMVRPRIDRIWDWTARLLFGSIAAMTWIVWGGMVVHGNSPDWPFLTGHLPPDFSLSSRLDDVVVAAILTILAVVAAAKLPGLPARGLTSWITGLTLCWALISMLWLPWIDFAKSYRSVFVNMRNAMPEKHRCIASAGLGESERAMLHYVLGYDTQRHEVVANPNCDLLLINGLASAPPADIDPRRWKLIWEGARPRDARERFWLYVAVQ